MAKKTKGQSEQQPQESISPLVAQLIVWSVLGVLLIVSLVFGELWMKLAAVVLTSVASMIDVLILQSGWVNRGRSSRTPLALKDPEAPAVAAALAGLPALSPRDDPRRNDAAAEPPPEEEFWDKYNRRLEFPLSTVATVLIHVLVASLLVFILWRMEKKDDNRDVNMQIMDVSGIDMGLGSEGSGGVADPLIEKMNIDPATAAIESLADPSILPEIREKVQQSIKLIDPTGNLPVTNSNAIAIAGLNEAVRNKLLGAQTGIGKQPGKGTSGQAGAGPGGSGADSTLGRNMRWTLRFKVSSGRNYLDQLQGLGAKILVPIPGTEKCLLIKDLNNLSDQQVLTADQLGQYGNLIKFWDSRRDAVGGVAGALGLDFRPTSFCAVFSKDFENDLDRKEKQYRSRRPEDIEETIFRVTLAGGGYEVVVDEQTVRRR
jgi:hypothetical protein